MRAASQSLLLLVAFVCLATNASVARAEAHRDEWATVTAVPLNHRRLSNGLTVVVQEDHRTPLVSLVLRYDVGERAAPQGLHGAAALTQRLASNASAHVPAGDTSRLLWRSGAVFSDATSTDLTVLSATLPAYRIALPLWLWSDQMGFFNRSFDDALFSAQRGTLTERLRATLEGSPLGRLDSFADEELFPPGHPYHEQLGTPESVARIGRAQILELHDHWMTPDHATLVIVGDVSAPEAFAEVERYFGPIPASIDSPRIPTPSISKLAGETLVDVQANIPNARISVRWPTAQYLSAEDAQLDTVAQLLTGQHRAFLYWELVTKQKVAVAVNARQRSRSVASEFEVSIEGAPGKTAPEILVAFDAAMDLIKSRSFEEVDVAYAAHSVFVDRLYALEGDAARAFEYAKYSALLGTPEFVYRDLVGYSRLTPSVIADAVTRFLPRDRRVVLLVTPSSSAAPGGERKGRRSIPATQP